MDLAVQMHDHLRLSEVTKSSDDSTSTHLEKVAADQHSDKTDCENVQEQILLNQLRNWIVQNKHTVRCRQDANFLLRFLRMKKHRLHDALKVLKKYLRMRHLEPHFFSNLDICDPDLNDLISRGYLFALPGRDREGRRVVISRAGSINPSRHSPALVFRANIMTFETLLEDEQCQKKGFSYLFDQTGIGFSHLLMWSPTEVAHIVSCMESVMPIRHQQLNVVNTGMLMHTVLEFVKTLISGKLRDRLRVHSSHRSLHTCLSADILPIEYGGSAGRLADMIELWKEELMVSRSRVIALDMLGCDGDPDTDTIELATTPLSPSSSTTYTHTAGCTLDPEHEEDRQDLLPDPVAVRSS